MNLDKLQLNINLQDYKSTLNEIYTQDIFKIFNIEYDDFVNRLIIDYNKIRNIYKDIIYFNLNIGDTVQIYQKKCILLGGIFFTKHEQDILNREIGGRNEGVFLYFHRLERIIKFYKDVNYLRLSLIEFNRQINFINYK